MTIRERIDREEARRAVANNQARSEYMERLYSQGWRPQTRPDLDRWHKRQAAYTCFALAALIAMWFWM